MFETISKIKWLKEDEPTGYKIGGAWLQEAAQGSSVRETYDDHYGVAVSLLLA